MTGWRMGRCALPPQTESSPAEETTEGTPVQQPQVYGLGRVRRPVGMRQRQRIRRRRTQALPVVNA